MHRSQHLPLLSHCCFQPLQSIIAAICYCRHARRQQRRGTPLLLEAIYELGHGHVPRAVSVYSPKELFRQPCRAVSRIVVAIAVVDHDSFVLPPDALVFIEVSAAIGFIVIVVVVVVRGGGGGVQRPLRLRLTFLAPCVQRPPSMS
jgi:hypothetical protein